MKMIIPIYIYISVYIEELIVDSEEMFVLSQNFTIVVVFLPHT